MDTKSKKFKIWERTAFRIIIFFLCGIFVAGAVSLALIGENRISSLINNRDYKISFNETDILSAKDFLETETFRQTANDMVAELLYLFTEFVEDSGYFVGVGDALDRAVENTLREIYESISNEIQYNSEYYFDAYVDTDKGYLTIHSSSYMWGIGPIDFRAPIRFNLSEIHGNPAFMTDGKMKLFTEPGVKEAFEKTFPEQISMIEERINGERMERYGKGIRKIEGMVYFVTNGERKLTNMVLNSEGLPNDLEGFFANPAIAVIEKGRVASEPEGLYIQGDFLQTGNGYITAFMAWPYELIAEYKAAFDEIKGIYLTYFGIALLLLIASIVLFILSIVFTGRKRPAYEDTRKLWLFDKIFVEFQVIILLFVTFFTGAFLLAAIRYPFYSLAESNFWMYIGLVGGVILVLSLTFLWFLLSLVRVGKAGLFAERSLIGLLVRGPFTRLGESVKTGYNGKNPLAKTLIFIILFWFVTALFAGICGLALWSNAAPVFLIFLILLFVALGLSINFTRKWVERYGRLRKGIEEIASGNLYYKIEIEGDGKNEFDRLSALVNELGSAHNTAIQSELKNQRLKTDLISNVSHDLKTPLTSIITYTDLLKTEGLKSKNAEEYLQIIDEKGRRLQKLTEDLFDAAKASSGAIPVRKAKVDLLALIKQEIAEMNGSFDAAGLELIIEAPEEHYFAEADSQLLWRVVDNLLRNAQKYAQAGTRVYIDLKEEKNMMLLEIKNTSAVKLNMPPEELMERFKRGDEARASEGSGLGLAIAKDLVRLMDGRFELSIDGDLFKAVVMLPPA